MPTTTIVPSGTNSQYSHWLGSSDIVSMFDESFLLLNDFATNTYDSATDSGRTIGTGLVWIESNTLSNKTRGISSTSQYNDANINFGNIVGSGDFSVYIKTSPLFNINDTRILSKSGIFEMGIDESWRVYSKLGDTIVRDSGSYLSRESPLTILSSFSSPSLSLTINGELVGTGNVSRPTGVSDFVLGNSGDNSYMGITEEFGLANSGLTDFYSNVTNLASYIDDSISGVPSTDYISFTIESGNFAGYNPKNNNSITTEVNIPLSNFPSGAYISGDNTTLKSWIYFSGDLAPTITFNFTNKYLKGSGNDVNWTTSVTPSGGNQLIVESGILSSGISTNYTKLNNHSLDISVVYPETNTLYSSNLKIYDVNLIVEHQ